jgi:hypothetical protein
VDWTVVRQRSLALGLGAVLTLGALWGAFWVVLLVLIAGQPPDAAAVDGEPCCPVPETWGEVFGLAGLALVLALIDAAVLAVGVALLVQGIRLRWPSRLLMLMPLVAVGVSAVVIAVPLVVRSLV